VILPPADAPAALPETGGVSSSSTMPPAILALGLILFAGGFGLLRLRAVRFSNK
jgi:hypothetical protein